MPLHLTDPDLRIRKVAQIQLQMQIEKIGIGTFLDVLQVFWSPPRSSSYTQLLE